VVGTRSEDHLEEAVAAASIELSPAELQWLETGDGDSRSLDG
jgi:aryl-alcohol dehydrogenase-like predicted oxidoreductase